MQKLTVTFLMVLGLVACGGGGGGNNSPPTADAGTNQTVNGGATVTLNGSASADSDGSIVSYAWTQTAGTAVTLSNHALAQPTFVAPDVTAATTLTFSLIVTDNQFTPSSAATVSIVVNPAPNAAPTANAGADQTTNSGLTVALNGTASADTDGNIASYAWTQTAGTAVTLTAGTTSLPTFPAPTVATATTLTFSLIVTDNRGAASAADTVSVVVNPPLPGTTIITGNVTFVRIPATAANGLDYTAPQTKPARGVLLRAVNTGTQAVVASTSTSNTGAYSLSVTNNVTIRLEVVSQMTRTGTSPTWNFRVQDGIVGNTPYVFTDGTSFNSSAGGAHDVAIPSGLSAAGVVTGTRASAPFAILDTVLQGVQTVVSAAATTDFPALVLDWAANNPGGETFFTSGPIQHIVLSGLVTEDTDEFDQHVIAHEFGHFIEFNFSRADNIGGPHGIGDKLDIRTAFGEGFGYAFAAIVLNDPDTRDTFFDVGCPGINHGCTSRFNVETNPSTTAPGTPDGNYGCWCSESSVWSILWDIYDDTPAEAGDGIALGFAPMLSVLKSAQKDTPAVTSIFSFITALKANNAGNAAIITPLNTLVAAQNIDAATINEFATNETHRPAEVAQVGALPVITTATLGVGPVIVQSVNDAGTVNKLGNHRLVRFTVPGTQLVTITVTTSNPNADADPDFILYRNGAFVTTGNGSVVGTETKQVSLTPATYVLDVYDCGNVCTDDQNQIVGTPGDYALTVTIN